MKTIITLLLAAVLGLFFAGCATNPVDTVKQIYASLPPGSVGRIDVGHHDSAGQGGIVITDAQKNVDGSGHLGDAKWLESYPLFQTHAEIQNWQFQAAAPASK